MSLDDHNHAENVVSAVCNACKFNAAEDRRITQLLENKMTLKLPPTVPARVDLATKPAKAPKAGPNVSQFKEWQAAISTAKSALGYDEHSLVYGKTDIEVITLLRSEIADWKTGSGVNTTALVDGIETVLGELLKRKIARVEAGKQFRAAKS